MRIRQRLLAGFVVLLGAVVVFRFAPWGRHAEPVARVERPFVPLEAVIESHAGRELVTPPRLPGPYRAFGSHALAAGHSATSRVRNAAGAVVEEMHLEGDPAFDRLVVFLDTADGGRTLVVMRRPR